MMDALFSPSGLLIILFCGSSLLLVPVEKTAILVLSCFSIGIGLISLPLYGFPVSLIFTVSGICSALILFFYVPRQKVASSDPSWTLRFPAFRAIFLFLGASAALTVSGSVGLFFNNPPAPLLAAMLYIIFLGLFHLGLAEHPFWTAINLLLIIQAFTILYCWVELSFLVVGLCAVVQLLLSLSGAILSAPMSDPVSVE
jgi:hypothetical protein